MLERLRNLDRATCLWAGDNGLTLLRIAVGVVFIWFGALKLFPGLSPAEGLIAESVSWIVDPTWFIPVLALWEVAIGVGLVTDRLRRLTIGLLFAHMAGTFMPLFACPELVWVEFPFAWTLEGQYIFKNLVLIAAGLTLHGRCSRDRTPDCPPAPSGQNVDPFGLWLDVETTPSSNGRSTPSVSSSPWPTTRPRTTISRP